MEKISRIKPNWTDTQERFMQWWRGEKMSRPMLDLRVFKSGSPLPPAFAHDSLEDKYTNVDKQIANFRAGLSNRVYCAESFPNLNIVWGLPLMALYFGGEATYLPDTVWIEHFVDDWKGFPGFKLDRNNPIFQKHLEMLKRAKELSREEFFINIPDIMERLDVIAAVRGSQELCYDLVDEPGLMQQFVSDLDASYEACYDAMYDAVKMPDNESTHIFFQIWAPGKVGKIQCDYSALMNPDGFKEFMLPGLKQQCDFLDYTIYHLDGKDAIPHLPAVMSLDKLNVLQWTPGDGQPDGGCEKWYPIYKTAREHGKGLWIYFQDGSIADSVAAADRLVKEFGPQGLYFHFYKPMDESAANDLIAHAERNWSIK